MPVSRYLPVAQTYADLIAEVLSEHGLQPEAARYVMHETRQGRAWLFVVFDPEALPELDPYLNGELQGWISAALGGRRVRLAEREVPRLAVLLSGREAAGVAAVPA